MQIFKGNLESPSTAWVCFNQNVHSRKQQYSLCDATTWFPHILSSWTWKICSQLCVPVTGIFSKVPLSWKELRLCSYISWPSLGCYLIFTFLLFKDIVLWQGNVWPSLVFLCKRILFEKENIFFLSAAWNRPALTRTMQWEKERIFATGRNQSICYNCFGEKKKSSHIKTEYLLINLYKSSLC